MCHTLRDLGISFRLVLVGQERGVEPNDCGFHRVHNDQEGPRLSAWRAQQRQSPWQVLPIPMDVDRRWKSRKQVVLEKRTPTASSRDEQVNTATVRPNVAMLGNQFGNGRSKRNKQANKDQYEEQRRERDEDRQPRQPSKSSLLRHDLAKQRESSSVPPIERDLNLGRKLGRECKRSAPPPAPLRWQPGVIPAAWASSIPRAVRGDERRLRRRSPWLRPG